MSSEVAELDRLTAASPDGWRISSLGEVALGKGEYGANVSKAEFDPTLPRYVRITDISDQGNLIPTSLASISVEAAKGHLLHEGDLLFARSGATVGKSFLYQASYGPCAFAGYLIRFRLDPSKIDPYFARSIVQSVDYWDWVSTVQRAQAQPNINAQEYASLPLLLPRLDEQRRIAKVLRSVDEAIAATQHTVRAAVGVRQVALDAMVQRVLDDAKTEVRPLCDIAEVRTGLAKNKNRTGPKVHVPYLRVANVQDGWFDLADMQDIEVDPGQVDRYLLQAGDVLLTEGGDYDKLGRGGVWHGQITPCLHQNHVFCVRPDTSALLPDYFALVTQSAWGRAYFLTCAKRTTNLASINSSQLRALPVPVVPTDIQTALIEEVAAIDAMIDLEERQLETLLRLRAEVSSDLLSGRVRVPA